MKKLYDLFINSKGISTDTRSLEKGQFFFALSGENFNADAFVNEALSKGASHVVCTDPNFNNNPQVTVVENALTTLQELAGYHRQNFSFPIIALTGSNGKTTTKELILNVLSQKLKVKATIGNFNNHIGVPLTLLSFPTDLDAGIVEMGANHQKEIAELCKIAKPDIGMITNYGKAHMEGFEGIEGIKKGKSEMYDFLRENSGKAIVATWDQEQEMRSQGIDRYFTTSKANLNKIDPFINLDYEDINVSTHLTGAYNYHNILFAITIGEYFGLSSEQIKDGIEGYIPSNNRSQIINKTDLKIILDAYNANPSSMSVALENLAKQDVDHKIAILGDMFELGEYSQEEHQKIADLSETLSIDRTILIGQQFYKTIGNQERFENFEDYSKRYRNHKLKGLILIKGSRGMKLERCLELFD
ncbi:UDP-N-acetylmuramoyl-tripeptide--D-alanyl-D-alanine ligase [Nonlabens spongiae]|uniref:UDP-N-acetylmuramoyl-tripeptide--D-alanyl-D-alanine ligase n=1 Tax=Nonlabens spongiae TaxID=331648 RepID=A0A1W6MLD1_9FLAO|nr:UDP-N-acetylmuramoyl-tripeptide--D-alanyl-D-alanine ligase [Nonlabens spongiae]ARN78408.1 UDP-N-acetylmuramoyl-tripeptide--D-alanyl-D-alanine ligase [Nonlabens spongiae]